MNLAISEHANRKLSQAEMKGELGVIRRLSSYRATADLSSIYDKFPSGLGLCCPLEDGEDQRKWI